MAKLEGKKAVVTAAGRGIGRAVARRLSDEGAEVIATDADLKSLGGLGGMKAARLDVTSTEAVEALAGEIGDVDILVNVAGVVHHGTVLTTSDEEWDRTFDINAKGIHRMIRAFLPGMIRRAEASRETSAIINMSSCASSLKGIPNRYAYGASKAAIIGMTKAVAVDFVDKGIRCNAICPGPVRTPSWEQRVDSFAETLGDRQKALDVYLRTQPMGRVGEAEEVASLALYLASDDSAFMTGVAIPLDGGLTL